MNSQLKPITEAVKSVVDFQWRFAVSSSNSRLAGQSECLIQVKFILRDQNSPNGQPQATSQLQLDLNIAEFNLFYQEMEKISNMIEIVN